MYTASPHWDSDNEYLGSLRFAQAHGTVTYDEFNKALLDQIRLFDVPKDKHIEAIEDTLDLIIKSLPAIKRIFTRPIIHLKDTDEIVPVESARIIDSHTLRHAALHSELWSDITAEGLKPRRLLTLSRVENYATYENIEFCRLIDTILLFTKKTALFLKDIIYGCRDLNFNLLDRTHHQCYFLALGKLHIEYARAHSMHKTVYTRCIEKLFFIEKAIRLKLRSPVYLNCKKHTRKPVVLKKTNTFRSHKDYKVIYKLLKRFESDIYSSDDIAVSEGRLSDEYKAFCILLSIFAIGHFNFSIESTLAIDSDKFKLLASYAGWDLTCELLSHNNVQALCFTVKKDISYTSILFLSDKRSISPIEIEKFCDSIRADEYFFATTDRYGESDCIYLSIFDIDSFRRLQQLLLRGMLYSDITRKHCPFCGQHLQKTAKGHECDVCDAEYYESVCPVTKKTYTVSTIKRRELVRSRSEEAEPQFAFLHDRYNDSKLHFRNITRISSDGELICPHCGKKH